MREPVMPLPIMVYVELEGRWGVVRWWARGCSGVCQYDFVGLGTGRETGMVVRVILIEVKSGVWVLRVVRRMVCRAEAGRFDELFEPKTSRKSNLNKA